MTAIPVKTDSAIAGVFRGYRPGGLYKLEDGSYWLQTGPELAPHHAVGPKARVLDLDDGLFLDVAGPDGQVAVSQLHDVIDSRIKGRFSGWTGNSVYTLTNGQVWQQAKFLRKYAVKYMPNVLIYADGAGHMMQVAGTLARVRRLK